MKAKICNAAFLDVPLGTWSGAPKSGLMLVYLHAETGAKFWKDDRRPRRRRWRCEIPFLGGVLSMDGPSLRAVVHKLTSEKVWVRGTERLWPEWAIAGSKAAHEAIGCRVRQVRA